jgi:hypothetical protein
MLVERNRLLLAIKNFSWLLLITNPYWSIRRFLWHAYAASKGRGAAGRFLAGQGWAKSLLTLGRAYISAARILPAALKKRRAIQKTKRLSNKEIMDLLSRFQIDLRQLTLRD